jgi:hypothetical protein
MECTGIFTARDKAAAHLGRRQARDRLGPGDGADLTVVYGVNHDKLTKDHVVDLERLLHDQLPAPVAKVLHEAIGIEKGMMTTIHSYTGDQPTLDTMHKDLYRARAAALSRSRPRPARPRRSASCCPSSRASSTAFDPRADPERLGRRPQVHRQTRPPKEEINAADRRRRRPAQGRSRLHQPSERLDRLQPRSAFLHLPLDQTKVMDGTLVVVILGLVRQRVGLLEPHVGYGALLVAASHETKEKNSGRIGVGKLLNFPGGGGPPEVPMLEDRVKALEARAEKIDASLQRLEVSLAEIKTELKSMPKAGEIGEIKGRIANLPTTWQLLTLLLTTWAAGAAIVFTVMKYGAN